MLRIILEETPETFYDAVRFGAVELSMLMGLRAEKIATIPLSPILMQKNVDLHGRNPAERGGLGHTMFLRHFSEKQVLRTAKSVIYAETSTSVPDLFETEVAEIVSKVEHLTAPLRERLQAQIQTGHIFPEFALDQIVPLTEIYPRLTGNPIVYESPENERLIAEYRQNRDLELLQKILATR